MIVGGSTAAALLGRWFLASSATAHAARAEAPIPVSVRVLKVAEEEVASGLRYSGLVRELRKADLSFRVPGTVEGLHQVPSPGGRMRDLHAGDVVPRGTVLARLDSGDYRRERDQAAQKLASAKARLDHSRANIEKGRLDHRRNEQLARGTR